MGSTGEKFLGDHLGCSSRYFSNEFKKELRIAEHLENEPGDHCTMMGDWQELSGFIRSKERKSRMNSGRG